MTTTPGDTPRTPVPIPPDVATAIRAATGYLEAYGWRDRPTDETPAGPLEGITLAQAIALGVGGAPVITDTVAEHRQRFELALRSMAAIPGADGLMYARGRTIATIRPVMLRAADRSEAVAAGIRRHAIYGVNVAEGTAVCACGVVMPNVDIDEHVTEGNR